MKIGIVTEYFYPTVGGITENIYHFSKHLLKLGHDFRIITSQAGDYGPIDPEVINRVIKVGKRIPFFINGSCASITLGFNLVKKFKKIFADEKFDILNIHSPQFPSLPLMALMYQDCPSVGTYHTCSVYSSWHKVYYNAAKPFINRLSGAIAVSDMCGKENKSYFDGPEYKVIPNGVEVSWWGEKRPRPDFMSPDYEWILFLGRPDRRNGLDVLLESFRKLLKKRPKARLLVVGDGPLMFYYKKLARDIKDKIYFYGKAYEERPELLSHSDVMCFIPEVASFGITVLEGMSAKCPMILSDIPAFHELVDEKSAKFVSHTSVDELQSSIEFMLENKDKARLMAESAHKNVGKYDWSEVAVDTVKYFEDVLNNCSRRL